MVQTTETSQAAAAAVAASGGAEKKERTDPDIFARELESKIAGSTSFQDRVAQSMSRLAGIFPGITVSSREMAGFAEITEYYAKVQDDATINISPQMMADMAEDDELFKRVQDMVSSLFTAGTKQNLVNAGGQNVHRNVSVQQEEVRYVEVQRTSNGTQLSVGSLSLRMQNEQMINNTLDQMLAATRGGGAQSSANRNTGQTPFLNGGFSSFVNANNAWRLEALLSAQSVTRIMGSWNASSSTVTANLMDQQLLQTSQTIVANIEIMIEQWQTEGGEIDLWSYMQIAGLTDPLVLDLGDEGINLRGPEDGVYFDIKGDGSPVKTAFIQGNNAFLYLDENGNGIVDDAGELFGDHGGHKNGFEKLAQYDDNGDGVNQLEESMTLAKAGIKSLSLRHDDHQALDAHGNVIGERSHFTRHDGSTGTMADVWLRNL